MAGEFIPFGHLPPCLRGKKGLAVWTWTVRDIMRQCQQTVPDIIYQYSGSLALCLLWPVNLLAKLYNSSSDSSSGNKSLVEEIKEKKRNFFCDSPCFLHPPQTTRLLRSIVICFPSQIPVWEEVVREITNCGPELPLLTTLIDLSR